MKIVITGSSGYLGSALVNRLRDKHTIKGIDIRKNIHDIEFLQTDLSVDFLTIEKFCKNIDLIIHCATNVPITRVKDYEFIKSNSIGTLNMLRASNCKFIHLSSTAVYGKPTRMIYETSPLAPFEPYGYSKAIAEQICNRYRMKGRDICIVRPRTIVGDDRGGVLSFVFKRASKNKLIPLLGNGSNYLQLIETSDLVNGILKIVSNNIINEDFNFGTDSYGMLIDDLKRFLDIINSKSKIVCLPKITRKLIAISDKLNILPFTPWHYETIFCNFEVSTDKCKRLLDWKPKYSNVEAIVKGYRSYQDISGSPHLSTLKNKLLYI